MPHPVEKENNKYNYGLGMPLFLLYLLFSYSSVFSTRACISFYCSRGKLMFFEEKMKIFFGTKKDCGQAYFLCSVKRNKSY